MSFIRSNKDLNFDLTDERCVTTVQSWLHIQPGDQNQSEGLKQRDRICFF